MTSGPSAPGLDSDQMSEDAELVLTAVRELGLADRANTSYPRWLEAAARLGS